MMDTLSSQPLSSCHCCGLIQTTPPVPGSQIAVCARCSTPLRHNNPRRNRWTAALAIAALAFYLPAMLLPMLRIERLGHSHEDSLLSGIIALWAQGHWFVGTVVCVFSVLLPPLKLGMLWLLTSQSLLIRHHHRALLYRLVERLGRWGMLDVLLVAVLIAFVKLGDLISIQAGRGLSAFIALVLLSLLASLSFNPAMLWENTETPS